MSNFTPGPWIFTNGESPVDHKTYKSPGYYENLSLVGRDGTTVCGCDEYNIFHGSVEDRCLIAAAPDLLEALEWALEQIGDDLDLDAQAALEAARATVRRAKGE